MLDAADQVVSTLTLMDPVRLWWGDGYRSQRFDGSWYAGPYEGAATHWVGTDDAARKWTGFLLATVDPRVDTWWWPGPLALAPAQVRALRSGPAGERPEELLEFGRSLGSLEILGAGTFGDLAFFCHLGSRTSLLRAEFDSSDLGEEGTHYGIYASRAVAEHLSDQGNEDRWFVVLRSTEVVSAGRTPLEAVQGYGRVALEDSSSWCEDYALAGSGPDLEVYRLLSRLPPFMGPTPEFLEWLEQEGDRVGVAL